MENGAVNCILSREDMIEHGLTVTDFIKEKEKVHDFLTSIVERAKEEVGYVNETGILSLRVIPMSKGRLSIIFSNEEEIEALDEMFHISDGDMDSITDIDDYNQDILSEYDDEDFEVSDDDETVLEAFEKDPLGLLDKLERHVTNRNIDRKNINPNMGFGQPIDGIFDDAILARKVSGPNSNVVRAGDNRVIGFYTKVLQFKSLERIIDFTKSLPHDEDVVTALFKDEEKNVYYIVLKKGKLGEKRFEQISTKIDEFADKTYINSAMENYLYEHCKCLIPNFALKKLSMLA